MSSPLALGEVRQGNTRLRKGLLPSNVLMSHFSGTFSEGILISTYPTLTYIGLFFESPPHLLVPNNPRDFPVSSLEVVGSLALGQRT